MTELAAVAKYYRQRVTKKCDDKCEKLEQILDEVSQLDLEEEAEQEVVEFILQAKSQIKVKERNE